MMKAIQVNRRRVLLVPIQTEALQVLELCTQAFSSELSISGQIIYSSVPCLLGLITGCSLALTGF